MYSYCSAPLYTPSLTSYTPSISTSEPSQDTYNILQNWIHSRSSVSLNQPVSHRFASEISIPVYKQLRRHCNELIAETNKQIQILEDEVQTLLPEAWNERKGEIDCNMTKINEIAGVISHPKVIKGIQQRINRGRKKRGKYSRGNCEIGDSTGTRGSGLDDICNESSPSKRLEIGNVEKLLSCVVKLRNLRSNTQSPSNYSSIFEEKVQDFQDRLSKQKKIILSGSQRTDVINPT